MSAVTVEPTEAEFQQQVIDLAHLLGWKHLHVRRTIGRKNQWVTSTNVKGWPDLFMWNERQQRTIAAELKSATGEATDEQTAVLASLAASGVPSYLWRPSDWPEIETTLRGGS